MKTVAWLTFAILAICYCSGALSNEYRVNGNEQYQVQSGDTINSIAENKKPSDMNLTAYIQKMQQSNKVDTRVQLAAMMQPGSIIPVPVYDRMLEKSAREIFSDFVNDIKDLCRILKR